MIGAGAVLLLMAVMVGMPVLLLCLLGQAPRVLGAFEENEGTFWWLPTGMLAMALAIGREFGQVVERKNQKSQNRMRDK